MRSWAVGAVHGGAWAVQQCGGAIARELRGNRAARLADVISLLETSEEGSFLCESRRRPQAYKLFDEVNQRCTLW